MLVVADSSPLIALIGIGHVDVLPVLYREVLVPDQVVAELSGSKRPPAVRRFASTPPVWFVERTPSVVEPIARLQSGERAAISLARELNADLLLIDETLGRRAAVERGIAIIGTVGILEQAARRGLLDLGNAFEALKRTDFWISRWLLDETLRLFLESRNRR